jgi:hypothetical protein
MDRPCAKTNGSTIATTGGRYYETNQYGAQMLRQSINNGYEEGFRAG